LPDKHGHIKGKAFAAIKQSRLNPLARRILSECEVYAEFATAVAQKSHLDRGAQASYSACVCHWGYGTDNSGDACTIVVSVTPRVVGA
jgi:hypothetical protein